MYGLILVAVCLLIYYIIIRPLTYWKGRNVSSGLSAPIVGENLYQLLGQENTVDMFKRIYRKFPNVRYQGIFQFSTPILIIKSPELIKQICVKDFEHFLNHKTLVPEGAEVLLSRNLVHLKDQTWKNMRSTLSPSFTTSKMKSMFTLISQNADTFTKYFLKKNENLVEVEFKDAFTRYTNDVIASTAFGLQVDSLTDRDNDFYVLGKEMTDFKPFWKKLVFLMYQMSPKLAAFLKLKFFNDATTDFFLNLVKDTIKYREENNIRRPDMLGLLLDARKGIQHEQNVQEKTKEAGFAVVEEQLKARVIKQELSETDIASQVFIFFFGGFDSVSTAMSYMALELAANPDVQSRLIDEIDGSIADPTYETIANLTYLDMVVCETLRKWPVNMTTDRAVSKPYTINPEGPGEKPVELDVNDVIIIPIIGIHYDPKYYSNPDKFDPERFSPENKKVIDPYTYLPFGIGPRSCIGSRFALLEIKAVFFHILKYFEFVPVAKSNIPIKLSKTSLNLSSEGFHLGLKKRNTR